VSRTSQGETKSGAVISGDVILKWKLFWSQVAACREVLSGRKDLPHRGLSTAPVGIRVTTHSFVDKLASPAE